MAGVAALVVGLVMAAVFVAVQLLSAKRTNERVEQVAAEVAARAEETSHSVDTQLKNIHHLVNSRLDEALERIALLEERLGLEPGEEVPSGQA